MIEMVLRNAAHQGDARPQWRLPTLRTQDPFCASLKGKCHCWGDPEAKGDVSSMQAEVTLIGIFSSMSAFAAL